MIAKLISALAVPVLDWAAAKLSRLISKWIRYHTRKNEIERVNESLRKQVEEANSKREREDAVKNSASHY